MSRDWLASHIRKMRGSGDPELKKLATEIIKFRKQSGIPVEQMGELYHINPKDGTIVRKNPITNTVLSEEKIGRTLINIAKEITISS